MGDTEKSHKTFFVPNTLKIIFCLNNFLVKWFFHELFTKNRFLLHIQPPTGGSRGWRGEDFVEL